MAYTKIIEVLRTLKLHGMADAFIELSQQAGFSQMVSFRQACGSKYF